MDIVKCKNEVIIVCFSLEAEIALVYEEVRSFPVVCPGDFDSWT